MNDDALTDDDTLTDTEAERLGRAYRAVSGERTPPGLNRTVLEDARKALAGGGHATAGGWLAPLAAAAALILAVAVLIEIPASDWAGDADNETRSAPSRLEEQASAPLADDRSLRKAGSTATNPARQGKVQGAVQIDVRNGHCDSEDTASADEWWRCIETLRNSGKVEAAEAEWLRLQERYPGSRRDQ